jgi:hypothetical protein
LQKDVDLIIVGSKSKNWTPSVQDAELGGCFFVIKLCDLTGSFPAVPVGQREKQWREFFLDPSQWWDHRSAKVIEHQFSQNSRVVDVNLATLSWLLSGRALNLGRSFSQPSHWWDSSSRLQKVMQYADGEGQHCFLCSCDHTYAWDVRVHG